MIARKPSHFGSNYQPRPVGSGLGLASIGSGSDTVSSVSLLFWWKRKGVKGNREGMPVAGVSDDRRAAARADEPGAFIFVHHRLVRLEGGG